MRIYFIGIGGIGVSALAQYYLAKGHQVSGSDLVASEITDLLKEKGVEIFIGPHKAENVPDDVSSVIYSAAVLSNNAELKKAKNLQLRTYNLQLLSYAQALGGLTKKYFTIAVCGTHGKSTTTAMIALILIKAGLDPTVIIGTKLKEFGNSNFRLGGAWHVPGTCLAPLVIEADEWQASFLNYWPKIIVLTNIEKEHLDYYKDLDHILKTYQAFIGHLPEDGILIANKDDAGVYRMTKKLKVKSDASLKLKVIYYSLKQKEANKLRKILKIPGEHNVSNALAALNAIRYGIRYTGGGEIPVQTAYKALSEYRGSWRRFEIKKLAIGDWKLEIVHDYAHHPTEIKATLTAARQKWPKKELWAVFQPHQFQRTFYLFDDFVRVLKEAPVDKLLITDIYDVAGRENKEIRKKVSAKKLVKALNSHKAIYLKKDDVLPYLRQNTKGRGVVVIVMGAGDIYKIT